MSRSNWVIFTGGGTKVGSRNWSQVPTEMDGGSSGGKGRAGGWGGVVNGWRSGG